MKNVGVASSPGALKVRLANHLKIHEIGIVGNLVTKIEMDAPNIGKLVKKIEMSG